MNSIPLIVLQSTVVLNTCPNCNRTPFEPQCRYPSDIPNIFYIKLFTCLMYIQNSKDSTKHCLHLYLVTREHK